jgi:aldose 1-epimerase
MKLSRACASALLLCIATALPARAQYAARRNGDLVVLEDGKNQMTVTIVPSAGNVATEFKVKGQNILRWPFKSIDEFRKGGLAGIPLLAPWANRLDEQAFYANGKKYAFDMQLGNVNGAIPIHGFLSRTDQWQVVEAKADGKSAWVTSKLDVFKQPMWMKQFPFAHTIEITHRLQDGVLEVHTKISNMSAEPMPVAIGFHPYYQLSDSGRDEWTISVGAKTHWKLAPVKTPTGETEAITQLMPDPHKAVLKEYNLDDVFGDLERDPQGRATMSMTGKKQRIDVVLGPTWKSIVIYAPNPANTGRGGQNISANNPTGLNPTPLPSGPPPDRNFVCFEPMAGITDAMNLAQKGLYKELQSIQPNGTWEASFWVKPSGF